MPTLFDELQKKLGVSSTPALAAPQQQTIQNVLSAKSGKQTSGTGAPGASNLGEQSAIQQGQAASAQQAVQGAAQGAAIGAAADAQASKTATAKSALDSNATIANDALATAGSVATQQRGAAEAAATDSANFQEGQQTEVINVKADQALRQLAADHDLTVDNIFRDFHKSEQDLAFRKDAAELEQRGFLLAMRDKSYIDELNRIGSERDLSDKLNFKEEMNRVVLGDQASTPTTSRARPRRLVATPTTSTASRARTTALTSAQSSTRWKPRTATN